MTVEWRPVPGYIGIYEASSDGRIKSVERHLPKKNGHLCRYRPTELKPFTRPSGHLAVNLAHNGVTKTRAVHQLILEAFVGPRPIGLVTRHLDGNPANNSLANICYGTQKENGSDVIRHKTAHNARKTHCKHGHEFTLENTYMRAQGGRKCRTCAIRNSTESTRKRRARERSEKGPLDYIDVATRIAEAR